MKVKKGFKKRFIKSKTEEMQKRKEEKQKT